MKLSDKKYCCGCSGCTSVCPVNAIKMVKDEEGFIYPQVDTNKCVECGKCERVCPILNSENVQINSHNLQVLQGYFKNKDKYLESASGGAATALSEGIIEQGGCIFGSTYYDGFKRAKYVKVESIEDLSLLKSSKYIETENGNIYKDVLEELESKRQVLFTGLPCDIGGLKCFLGKEYDNLYTCELICHGPTAQKVQEQFIEYLSDKYKSRVIYFNSRYKVSETSIPYIKVIFESGREYTKPLWDTEYGYAFAVYNRLSCYDCVFKGNKRVADITVGDSWCAEKLGKDKAVSIIYTHTKKR